MGLEALDDVDVADDLRHRVHEIRSTFEPRMYSQCRLVEDAYR